MKKTLAAIGASLLGLAGAVGAGAAPASAALPAACTDATQHVVSPPAPDPSSADWYMSCTPQYGMGKAEFTITPPAGDATFPEGYSLTDGNQTVVSSTPSQAAVESYFAPFYAANHGGSASYSGAFMNLHEDADSTATSQSYGSEGEPAQQTVAFQISSLTKIAGSALPAACFPTGAGASYDAGYVITYAPTTTTWSETIAGKTYLTTVTATSPTLYLGLNFVTGGSFGFNDEEALCATSGAGTLYGGGSGQIVASAPASGAPIVAAAVPTGSDAWYTIANDVATNDPGDMTTLVPTVADENSPAAVNYGSFALALQTAALDPPAAKPVLAPTGADAAPAGILGGALLLGGVGAVSFGRRRRVARA